MRPKTLAVLFASTLLAASPAFAQMTQQNKSNQGNAAHPPNELNINQVIRLQRTLAAREVLAIRRSHTV